MSLLNSISESFAAASQLPGERAHGKMAPSIRPIEAPSEALIAKAKKSAVLICLVEREGEMAFPIIRRVQYSGTHSGQIGLPGGRFEEEDQDLKNTAIRECWEETGLKANRIMGALSPLYIPPSNSYVQPFVGFCDNLASLKIQKEEVEDLFFVPLKKLLDYQEEEKKAFLTRYGKVMAPYFLLEDQEVWGATSMILKEFQLLLKPKKMDL